MSSLSKFVAEAVGTFALCFVGAGAICVSAMQNAGYVGLLGVAMAHGLILSVGVSATMAISGAHLNPAVTLAMLLTGRIRLPGAVQYIIAQLLGGVVAGMLVLFAFSNQATPAGDGVAKACQLGTPNFNDPAATASETASTTVLISTAPLVSPQSAALIEVIMTFLLVFVIFGTAVDPRAPKIGGFGIGLVVAACILFGGPLTGAAMNPARCFGTGVVAALSGNFDGFWAQQWVYWAGPIVGAILGAIVYDKAIMEPKRA